MSNKDNFEDADLKRLYEQRKQDVSVPSSIKRAVIAHDIEKKVTQHWKSRAGFVALAASTLLLVSVVTFLPRQFDNTKPIEISLVQNHDLTSADKSLSKDIRDRHAEHYQAYLKNKALFAAHYRKPARILPNEQGLALQTCNDEVINVSESLLAALTDIQAIDAQLQPGDMVLVSFAKNGIILSIETHADAQMCS